MRQIINRWRTLLKIRWLVLFFLVSILAVLSSLKLQAVTGRYADRTPAFPVPDLILDRIPAVDLEWLIVWGYLGLLVFGIAAIAIYEPERLPFALITFALFVFVRALFVTLTHLAPPGDAIEPDFRFRFLQGLSFYNDLFFSGHTGFPFLVFLLVQKRWVRYVFLTASFAMGAAVLFTHLHYSIDVFAAFFITYAIYKMSERLFGRWRMESP
ncbi:hypothetical protein HYW67_04220 [Candidatus Parcubacteria bacterium]|nr:hypothetical protein [Candidatus Parcubacteria bacterium]